MAISQTSKEQSETPLKKKRGLQIRNESAFSKYTPEACYWAGFLAADGNISSGSRGKMNRIRLYLAECDIGHLEKFKKFLGSDHKVTHTPKYRRCSFEFCSSEIAKDLLEKYGIGPKKSLTYTGPDFLPDDMWKHFIRGVFDGDGSASEYLTHRSCKHKSFVANVMGTKFLIEKIKPIVYSAIDKKNVIKDWHHPTTKDCRVMYFSTNDAFKFMTWMYEDISLDICLTRKQAIYEKLCIRKDRSLNIEDSGIVHA